MRIRTRYIIAKCTPPFKGFCPLLQNFFRAPHKKGAPSREQARGAYNEVRQFAEFSTIRGLICAIPVVNRAAAARAALQMRLPISLIPAAAAVQTTAATTDATAPQATAAATTLLPSQTAAAPDARAAATPATPAIPVADRTDRAAGIPAIPVADGTDRAAGIPAIPATDGTVRAAAVRAAALGRTRAVLAHAVPVTPARTPITPASTPLPIAAPVAIKPPHEKTQGYSLRFCHFTLRIRRCGIHG